MGMIKKGSATEAWDKLNAPITVPESGAAEALTRKAEVLESGAEAAIERLSNMKASNTAVNHKPAYKARDYDAEALGKTRCVQYEAALMSPAIAGMRFDTMEEYLKLVRQAAEAGVAFSFEK